MPEFVGEDAYAMVVADGMGGMNAGDVASMLAISTGVKLADKSVKWGFKINEKEAKDLLARLSAYFREIDRRITRKSESGPQALRHGHDADPGLQRRRPPVPDPRRRLAGLPLPPRPAPATDPRPHRGPGPGRRRPHQAGGRPQASQAEHPDQLPRRPPGQDQGRRPLAPPRGRRPGPPLQRRPQRHGRGPGDRPVASPPTRIPTRPPST